MEPFGLDKPPRLSVLILGPPVVSIDGKAIKITRREQRAGIYYLAGHVTPISRVEICDTFWPKDSEISARKKLRVGLSRLRSDLKDSELLITENDLVSLNPDRVYVDAREYNEIVLPLLNSSELNGSGKLPDWCYQQLIRAMTLCRGNQVVQGFSLPHSSGFENWHVFTNQAFNFSREKIIERLADHCIAIGNLDEAMLWLGKAIDADQLNTDINYLMLECFRERGRHKEALDFIELLEPIYAGSPLGALPQTIVNFRKRLQADPKPQKTYERPWPGAETNAVPFIGRNDLLKKLTHAYHRKGLIHITGPSGCGKNRLVQEFYSRLEFKPRLVFCIGRPMVSSSPFSILLDGLQTAITEREWSALPDYVRRDLSPFFPEYSRSEIEKSREIGRSAHLESFQSLLEAFRLLLVTLADKKPLLFVIDIAKWCDEATFGFLNYLNERDFFMKHGLLVLLSRSEDHNQAFEIFLDRSTLTNGLETIEVPPLSLEETVKLVTTMFGKELQPGLVEKVQIETGGNPFFLIETLRYMQDQQLNFDNLKEHEYFPIPPTVRAMAQEKLRPLSLNAREVLVAASVLGQRFLPEVLEEMLVISGLDMVKALEDLMDASILVGDSGLLSNAHYEFLHDQIREVVLESLSPARKRLLHLEAVRALTQVRGEAPELATVLAYHYSLAGEYGKAFAQWCKAGRYARLQFSSEDCFSAFQKASDLLPSISIEENKTEIQNFFSEWIDLCVETNDLVKVEVISRKCLELGEHYQEPIFIGLGYSGLGQSAVVQNRMDDAFELLQRARYYFSKARATTEILETIATLGYILELSNDFSGAQRCYEEGMKIAKEGLTTPSLKSLVTLQSQFSIFYTLIGRPGQAMELSNQAVNDSLLINSPSTKVRAYTALALSLIYSGKYRKSIEHVNEVYQLAEQYRMFWWKAFLDLILARDYLAMGYLDECWQHVSQALNSKKRVTLNHLESIAFSIKGDFYRLLGDLNKAEAFYRQGIEITTVSFPWLENYYMLGLVLWQQGRAAESLAYIDEVIVRSTKDGWESLQLISSFFKNLVADINIPTREAVDKYDSIISDLKGRGYGSVWMNVEFDKNRLLLGLGEAATAKSNLLELTREAYLMENRLLDIATLNLLLKRQNLDAQDRQGIQARLGEQLMIVAAHALKPPAIGQYKKLRASLQF